MVTKCEAAHERLFGGRQARVERLARLVAQRGKRECSIEHALLAVLELELEGDQVGLLSQRCGATGALGHRLARGRSTELARGLTATSIGAVARLGRLGARRSLRWLAQLAQLALIVGRRWRIAAGAAAASRAVLGLPQAFP